MSSPIRHGALAGMVLALGVAVVAAQQPAARQPLRQALPPGTAAQPRQPGQIGQQQPIGQQGQVIQQRQPGQIGQQGQIIQQRQPGQIGQGQATQQRQGGQQGQRGQWDQQLVTLLIIDNNKEIALGQLAERTSKNEKVQEFAQMIQKDHGNFVQKLQELSSTSGTRGARLDSQQSDVAGQPGRAGIAERAADRAGETADRVGRAAERVGEAIDKARQDLAGREDQDRQRGERDRDQADRRESREGADASRYTVARPVISNAPGSELLQFCQDVAEECLNSARKDAQQQSGEEFDKHFVGGQIIAHKGMLDKLRVAERNASPQLAQLLRDAQGTTKQHLEHAEQLIAELGKGESREGGAARDRGALREGAIERREGAQERRERQEQ